MISGLLRWNHCSLLFSFHLYWGLQQEYPASKFGNQNNVDVNNFSFLLASLESNIILSKLFLNCFHCTNNFFLSLHSSVLWNTMSKCEGYGNKFPVLIEQSVLENLLSVKAGCASCYQFRLSSTYCSSIFQTENFRHLPNQYPRYC